MDLWSNAYAQYIKEWTSPTPLNMMLLFLCVYSLVINYNFGHPTYWRKSKSIGSLTSLNQAELVQEKAKGKPKHMEFVLQEVNPDILVHIWGYLTPYELTVTSQLSRSYRTLSSHPKLWLDLTKQLPTPRIASKLSPDPRVRYFETLMFVIEGMLQDADKLVIYLQGDLYDLTYFANEHPGGDAILHEYKGKDATVMFERVTHSAIALQVKENLLLFSPDPYKGASGWPRFAIK
jgi:hypothetical protein